MQEKETLKTGLLLGIVGIFYWVLSLLSSRVPLSIPGIISIVICLFIIILWVHRNYTIFSSYRDDSLLTKIIQLYGISFIILIIGTIGSYFNLGIFSFIFSVIYSIYFVPFFDIANVIFRGAFKSINYLLVPFCVMLSISLVTFIFYRTDK